MGNGKATRRTKSRYLKGVIVRDVLVLGTFLVLLALPSLIGTTAWFAREVAEMLAPTPGAMMTGSANVYQYQGELTYVANSSVSVPVGSVDWSLSSSVAGMSFRPLRQAFTLTYVPNASSKISTAEIDALVARAGLPIWGVHPHFKDPQPELVVRSSDGLAGLDSFGVIQVRPGQKAVLYPLRTLGTLRNMHPWILRAYYAVVVACGLIGLFMIRTVGALRRRERDLCVRCGYPRGTACECTECGLVYPRPLIEPELTAG